MRSNAGLPFSTTASAIAMMLPRVVQRLAPGGAIAPVPTINRQRWIGAERRFGSFEFRQGHATANEAERRADQAMFNRAVDAYLKHMPTVSWFRLWTAAAETGPRAAGKMVIWEDRIDAP